MLLFLAFVLTCLSIGIGAKLLDRVEIENGETNDCWRRTHEAVRDADNGFN